VIALTPTLACTPGHPLLMALACISRQTRILLTCRPAYEASRKVPHALACIANRSVSLRLGVLLWGPLRDDKKMILSAPRPLHRRLASLCSWPWSAFGIMPTLRRDTTCPTYSVLTQSACRCSCNARVYCAHGLLSCWHISCDSIVA